jgi:hypothetical protein
MHEAWVIGVAIIGAGGIIGMAVERLRVDLVKQGDLLRARFCDFAFESEDADSRRIAVTSQLRWLVRAAQMQHTGKWDHPATP